MASTPKLKRGPSVLVTDTRDKMPTRPSAPPRSSTKLISVDNVLQYASDLPSQQRRAPPGGVPRPVLSPRTPSGRHPLEPKLSGRGPIPTQMQHVNVPSRASKVSERLVMLPETGRGGDSDSLRGADAEEDESKPPSDEAIARRRKAEEDGDRSYAERLPKAQRSRDLARVTAYGVAQAYKLKATGDFVRQRHGARAKLYDDCLYTVYHLPLLSGSEGFRVRSSPVLKSPGGKAVLDEEIERNERREYREGYFEEGIEGLYAVKDEGEEGDWTLREREARPEEIREHERWAVKDGQPAERVEYAVRDSPKHEDPHQQGHENLDESPGQEDGRGVSSHSNSNSTTRSASPTRLPASTLPSTFAEMFVFSYGVVVFWNFTETQEKDLLADLTFASTATGTTLATRPQLEEDFETEELHFEYNTSTPRPRLFNDMITLKSGDHMIKLTMSHAIAQSTKLSFFEERMSTTMLEAQYVPKRLALTGKLGMKREDVVKILGRLYTSRVEVNLSSNMLDVPNFFWDAEPHLHPLYVAVREYMEIESRIKVLNERCKVFLELAEILGEAVADKKMSRLTWIIIVLIVISIVVTCSETLLRYGILNRSRTDEAAAGSGLCENGEGNEELRKRAIERTVSVGANAVGRWMFVGARWALRLLAPIGGIAVVAWKGGGISPWGRL
ncbi:MAG: hypothetical protein M1820_003157 [Bogoriella megaspora]|nr:MAG: hypothetical protein M1820_003157 [Bogoriella megaspora]